MFLFLRTHTPNTISHRVRRMHQRRDHNQGRQDPPLDLHPHPKHDLAPGPGLAPPPRSQPGETTPSPTPAPTPQTQSHARSNARTTTEITTRGDNTLPYTRTHTPNTISRQVQRTHHHRDRGL
ncbi:hypothetical protein HMPREF9004_0758 [Schaalia cardiffensis F0333]|uniref:Uncharacterized protein n=1 Tax=Schaalia cardiffensis F0333 TaxID=888050 RepID=N6X447_9ACTO|nr:hypothetical protein HMPREF9004_0758 [Schaalia cardiffensis F0333]